jgi:hypothetical protein
MRQNKKIKNKKKIFEGHFDLLSKPPKKSLSIK